MKLFESAQLGSISLKNRIVMAPLTRSRATGNIPNDLMALYYGQRAGAGLIVTEGTSPSPNGLGYARIPGLFNQDHVVGWRRVTGAVHAGGAKIFVQLMHTGRVSHSANMPAGSHVLAPSALQLGGQMWTDTHGLQDHPVPEAMTGAQIESTIDEYVAAAKLAVAAGFDGVEVHAANGYLIEQFLNPNVNKRTDEYGGTAQGRKKFLLAVARKTVEAIGGERVGVRVSPYGVFNETGPFPGIDQFYADLAGELSNLGVTYIHVVDHSPMGAPPVSPEVKRLIRENFKGAYILSGGYDLARAEVDLKEGRGDLVAFGRPFISNPDLVERLKRGLPLAPVDDSKLYTPGAEGYSDYPVATG